ncbi:MAG: vitamin B12 dependent-methionine synthase activation domain-containing protein [Elusimicrobiota bacterium]
MPAEKIKNFKIKLRKPEILRYLGYTSRAKGISPDIEKDIQRQIEEAYALISPAVLFKTFNKNKEEGKKVIEKILKSSDRIMELVSKADIFTIMAVTVGKSLEKKVADIKKEDLTGASILDAAGSEAAEQTANYVSSIIRNRAREKNCILSIRFSPGYGDWPVKISAEIIDILDGKDIGISVNNSSIMSPRKSITAFQAWIPAE